MALPKTSKKKVLGETVPATPYGQIHKRLHDLIIRGTKVADATAGTPPEEIHDWIDQAQTCLGMLKDRMPKEFSDFKTILGRLEFRVTDEQSASKSSYVPDDGDDLADFRFEDLRQLNGILKFAARKVVELINAAESSSKNVFFDVRALKAARAAMNVKQADAASWFDVDVRTFRRWEGGQPVMRREANRRLDVFLEWARQGHKWPPPGAVKKMSS